MLATTVTPLSVSGQDLRPMSASHVKASAEDTQSPVGSQVQELIDKGWELLNSEHYSDAEATFTEAITQDPKSVDALYGRAVARYCLEKMELALEDLGQALAIDSKNLDVLFGIGFIQEKMGHTDLAIAAYNEMLVIVPDDVAIIWRVCNLHYSTKNLEGCVADLSRIIELTPDDPWAYYYRGVVHKEMGNKELAKADFQKASEVFIATNPDYQAIQDQLASLMEDQGEG